MYNILAKFYDELLGFDYEIYDGILSKIIKEDQYVLDLATGSGNLLDVIKKYTSNIMASDLSQDMLLVAKEKHPYINFFTHDLKEDFHVKGLDVVTCVVDSINYLLEKSEVENLFRNVYENLKVGGYFVFDVHSEHKLVTLKDYSWHDDFPEYTYIWDTYVDEEYITHLISFFTRIDELYERTDEEHVQRVYSKEYLFSLLDNFKIEIIEIEDRYIFVCEKTK